MGELVDGQPLFPGDSEIDQLYVVQVYIYVCRETAQNKSRVGNTTVDIWFSFLKRTFLFHFRSYRDIPLARMYVHR